MRMRDTFIKPMHPEGRKFVAIFALITLVLFLIWEPLGWIGVLLTVWCYYFFRDPERVVPARPGLVVSPADGMVSLIEKAVPPAELGMPATPLTRVSVFMSVFNCHVNRSPVEGELVKMSYRPGKFLNASLERAPEENERSARRGRWGEGREIAVVEVAGLGPRRIMWWKSDGDWLHRGERFGLIRFGSRLDVYLPEGVAPLVSIGQTMVAGETVLADLTLGSPHD